LGRRQTELLHLGADERQSMVGAAHCHDHQRQRRRLVKAITSSLPERT
jgi:hypothetical protein